MLIMFAPGIYYCYVTQQMRNHSSPQFQTIHVSCHSGRGYADRPVSLVMKGELYKISEIEREWFEPGEKHFIVRSARAHATESEKRIHICYDTVEDLWRLCENQ